MPYTELLDELLEFVDDVLDELGSREDVYYAREIVKRGTGADRQLAVYAERLLRIGPWGSRMLRRGFSCRGGAAARVAVPTQ